MEDNVQIVLASLKGHGFVVNATKSNYIPWDVALGSHQNQGGHLLTFAKDIVCNDVSSAVEYDGISYRDHTMGQTPLLTLLLYKDIIANCRHCQILLVHLQCT